MTRNRKGQRMDRQMNRRMEKYKNGPTDRRQDKSTPCGSQHLAVGCLVEDKKSKSKKGYNTELEAHEHLYH